MVGIRERQVFKIWVNIVLIALIKNAPLEYQQLSIKFAQTLLYILVGYVCLASCNPREAFLLKCCPLSKFCAGKPVHLLFIKEKLMPTVLIKKELVNNS